MHQTPWTKSSYSEGREPNCVECRTAENRVQVRDSQHPHLGYMTLPTHAWTALLHAVRIGKM
ncbi:DUF397 domain-containing protein [Lipingzhangella sp. LS1_29]|uniref:DUF397 domain-containing protein n=1 Tax=Lipingzhangella rawalii TaxID=2055835 RepID=A0ABU2H0Y1_9ACTN|nr:DUF397 domain-containing protein [Lipingzhangella rawalii]MDS1268957.1 DUF397 domain-containing protein [Lipingzhangella rawalii]